MGIKVLIADDDIGMRMVLRKIVEKVEGFEVAAEAEDGNSVLCFLEKIDPQVIFLDIEMPGLDGIECAKMVSDIDPKKMIIFATAHPEFMPEAFEVYAFDYITKPFKIDRVIKTLSRIKDTCSSNYADNVKDVIFQQSPLDKLIIKNKDGVNFIDMEDIVMVQREGRSTVIYTNDDKHMTSETLGDIESKLEKTLFYRCHKSYIINMSKISKISPYGRWTYIVNFKDCDKDALITHKKYEELEKIFEL
ncbi:LytR/AlgR family response regulator transcription factor [Brassicibacter mesophilus]|uniref:LytR/AlgR family response regulator transcription factor n=1 Tax=Brassicibacter mesophilus TaxID=745119 RepID=UPI003D1DC39D